MGDLMRAIPFGQLLRWVFSEYENEGSIFGARNLVRCSDADANVLFGEKLETPFGPAAGPNTQLAQNIIAAYVSGARFFELKTVQQKDGRELAACVPKPCIASGDECYNCEWSTELTVEEAFAEYVKAWFICRILAKEYGFGSPDGFIFNMSVGYDLEGIKTEKIDRFIEGMKDASGTEIYRECLAEAGRAAEEGLLKKADAAFLKETPSRISNSITESTLHGCPPDEIERIASYLIEEKGLHTFIKCNPTLLGYDFARKTLDELGFGYVAFDDHHFLEDLQWADAVPMLHRLMELAREKGVEFGVKLTNTFPVDVKRGELPSEEMYMSGRSLFPLTIELADRITREFDGKLRISYSGGADEFNIREIVAAGIWPVTMATTILKPGGYGRLAQIARDTAGVAAPFKGVDAKATAALVVYSKEDAHYRKPIKPVPSKKMEEELPLLDCFAAPCRSSCPIGQDIPAYLQAMVENRSRDALRIILERNALPFLTGTLCPHTCAERCMRGHYEASVNIREVKLLAAERAFGDILPELTPPAAGNGKRIAVIGAGPAGLSSAYYLSRAGADVTIFEKREKAGGVPRYAIPGFRIGDGAIDRDVQICLSFGAKLVTGREITSAPALLGEGFDAVIIAVGAWDEGSMSLEGGEAYDALEFLQKAKADPASLDLGREVAVIGGGFTAMDVARAAKIHPGVEHVRVVYRRDKRSMPADEEELQLALDEGVEFIGLLSPLRMEGRNLICAEMRLGAVDASGRRAPEPTGVEVTIPADSVIAAVGERIDTAIYREAGAAMDDRGRPIVDENLQTTVPGIYAAGDCRRGPATIVKAEADAQIIAQALCGVDFGRFTEENAATDREELLAKKGLLIRDTSELPDRRCLGCASMCGVCADVCPNRANVVLEVPGLAMPQILHIDGMCNECGNCAVFCPYSGRPYKDKATLFWTEEDFNDSENAGFLPLEEPGCARVRLGGAVRDYRVTDPGCGLYEPLRLLILHVMEKRSELIR